MLPLALLTLIPSSPVPRDAVPPPPPPVPVVLTEMSVEAARRLHSRAVSATLEVGTPPMAYPDLGVTAFGSVDADGTERTIYLAGDQSDAEDVDWVSAVGELRVVEHEADGEMPAWVEVRVDEGRP